MLLDVRRRRGTTTLYSTAMPRSRSRPRLRLDDEPQRPWPTLDVPVSQRFARLQNGTSHASSGSTADWLRRATVGRCEQLTDERVPGRCDTGSMGSWPLKDESADWWAAADQCLRLCELCQRCRVLSVSLHYMACSWHAECDVNALHARAGVFLTAATGVDAAAECERGQLVDHSRRCAPSSISEMVEPEDNGKPRTAIDPSSTCSRRRFPEDESSYVALVAQASTQGSAPPSLSVAVPIPISADAASRPRVSALSVVPSPCLESACVLERLSGLWIVMVGDSTHRMLHDAWLDLLDGHGASCLSLGPHVAGLPVVNHDGQKDFDSVCLIPPHAAPSGGLARDLRAQQRAPRRVSGRRRGLACRPAPNWTDPRQRRLRVSMRFLRGLDHSKLVHNSRDWRQRLHYVEWLARSAAKPANMVLGSDPPEAHPVSRVHWASARERPDVIVFHSCAWDLPRINQSAYYFAGMGPWACGTLPGETNVSVSALPDGRRAAPVLSSPCVRRGQNLTDDEIFDGFRTRLRASIRHLLHLTSHGRSATARGAAPRLIVRNCHAGTRDSRVRRTLAGAVTDSPQPQLVALERMNAIIEQVATELCVEVLDVWSLDRLAGGAADKKEEDFHVPQPMAMSAAFALMLMLSRPEVGSVRRTNCR